MLKWLENSHHLFDEKNETENLFYNQSLFG